MKTWEKSVVLDANHHHSPFPAPFLIQEMRTRRFHPWCTDRPIPHPRSTIILLATILEAAWQIWEVEVILGSVWVGVAGADRMEVVERRVLVANPHPQESTSNILFPAILFRIQNCSNPCAVNGNSSRIGNLQQSRAWPGKGRRIRTPGNLVGASTY